MKVKVKYTAQLKKAIGSAEEIVETENNVLLRDLLTALFFQKKKEFQDIVFDSEGQFLGTVLLIINGQQVNFNHAEPLKENDVVTIMSPIAGG